jgi:putative component of membrane protein insertase Oxa1/YidC/SpoIIIJ protein YidD
MLKKFAIRWIERYQRLGGERQFAVNCNFKPSCSEYTKQAIECFGLYRGLKVGFKRLKRCNHPDLIHPIEDPLIRQHPTSELTNRGQDAFSISTKSE